MHQSARIVHLRHRSYDSSSSPGTKVRHKRTEARACSTDVRRKAKGAPLPSQPPPGIADGRHAVAPTSAIQRAQLWSGEYVAGALQQQQRRQRRRRRRTDLECLDKLTAVGVVPLNLQHHPLLARRADLHTTPAGACPARQQPF